MKHSISPLFEFFTHLSQFSQAVGFLQSKDSSASQEGLLYLRYCQRPTDMLVGVEMGYSKPEVPSRQVRLYVMPDMSFEWAGFLFGGNDGRPKCFELEGGFTHEINTSPAVAANAMGLQMLDWVLKGQMPTEIRNSPGLVYQHLTYTPDQD